MVISGLVQEQAQGKEELGSAASVVVKSGDVKHANVFGPQGAKVLSIAIPDTSILGTHTVDGWCWYHGGPVSQEAVRFFRAYQSESAHPCVVEEGAYALVGALREATIRKPDHAVPPLWLQQIRERLHDTFTDSYSVSDLAREADIHPVYLTRMFRRYFGCSVTRYMQRLRVHQAANRLASSDQPMAQLALEAGFFDQSHLSRAFKMELGQTPGQFRAHMQRF